MIIQIIVVQFNRKQGQSDEIADPRPGAKEHDNESYKCLRSHELQS